MRGENEPSEMRPIVSPTRCGRGRCGRRKEKREKENQHEHVTARDNTWQVHFLDLAFFRFILLHRHPIGHDLSVRTNTTITRPPSQPTPPHLYSLFKVVPCSHVQILHAANAVQSQQSRLMSTPPRVRANLPDSQAAPPTPGSSLHSLGTVMVFSSDSRAGPADHPGWASASEDRQQQTPLPFLGGCEPAPCSARIIGMQD